MNLKRMSGMFQYFNKANRAAYLFITPAILILLFFTVAPLLATIGMSTLRLDIFLKSFQFLGFENFSRLLHDDRFWNSLKNTIYFTFVEMPLQIFLSLLTAVFVSKNTLFRKFLRSVFFLPSICSFTAIGIIWSFLLDPQLGMYPYYLTKLGLPLMEFLRDPQLAMPSIIMMTVWRNFGYTMVIFVAGLQSIPSSYYEAAQIDGASPTKRFFHITIPMLIPSLSFCMITSTIAALQIFDQIFVTTQGGPLYKTESIVSYIYNIGFSKAPYELGYASAISVILFLLIMALALLMNNYFLKKETEIL